MKNNGSTLFCLQFTNLRLMDYQQPPSVGSLGHSTIGSAGLSPTQSISSTSSGSSASPDVSLISTPNSPSINNCASTDNAAASSGTNSNNYSFNQHHMDIAAR